MTQKSYFSPQYSQILKSRALMDFVQKLYATVFKHKQHIKNNVHAINLQKLHKTYYAACDSKKNVC